MATFEEVKEKLAASFELFQADLDQPFQLKCDASDKAFGVELLQCHNGQWVPVAFYSGNFAGSILNWSIREKEAYAIVASLRKWAGTIGFQPVMILTDHQALEDWVTENVDTPSGPRGRKARWHETLSQFDLEIKYILGEKILSRIPYHVGHIPQVRTGRMLASMARRRTRGSEKNAGKKT